MISISTTASQALAFPTRRVEASPQTRRLPLFERAQLLVEQARNFARSIRAREVDVVRITDFGTTKDTSRLVFNAAINAVRGKRVKLSSDSFDNVTSGCVEEAAVILAHRVPAISWLHGSNNKVGIFSVVVDRSLDRANAPPIAIKAKAPGGAEIYFVGFNNGTFNQVIVEYGLQILQIVEIDQTRLQKVAGRYRVPDDLIGNTIDALRFIAPATAWIGERASKGFGVNLRRLGKDTTLKYVELKKAVATGNEIIGHVEQIDELHGQNGFVNVVTNITVAEIREANLTYGDTLLITINGVTEKAKYVEHSTEVGEGELLLINGSKRQRAEIWVREGNAAEAFNLPKETNVQNNIEVQVVVQN